MLEFRRLLCLVIVLPFIAGCAEGEARPELCQVTGTVKIDGVPLAEASVIFEPQSLSTTTNPKYKRSSDAITDAQGQFLMSTYGDKDGLPAGKYKVAVVKQSRKNPPGMDPEMATEAQLAKVVVKNLIPAKYFDLATSGLEVEVTPTGMQPDVLELQSK